jgi:hypothetical protein
MLSNADVATSATREDPGSVSYRSANGQFNLYQTEFAEPSTH